MSWYKHMVLCKVLPVSVCPSIFTNWSIGLILHLQSPKSVSEKCLSWGYQTLPRGPSSMLPTLPTDGSATAVSRSIHRWAERLSSLLCVRFLFPGHRQSIPVPHCPGATPHQVAPSDSVCSFCLQQTLIHSSFFPPSSSKAAFPSPNANQQLKSDGQEPPALAASSQSLSISEPQLCVQCNWNLHKNLFHKQNF